MPFIVPAPLAPAPVPAPVGPSLAGRAFASLPSAVRDSDDGTLAALLEAVAAPVAGSAEVLLDPSAQTDPWRCEWSRLGWLAAMAGVDCAGVPDLGLRAWIADPRNRFQGSVGAIRARVGLTLTGARQVRLVWPYLGDNFRMYVSTLAGETPDVVATLAAIEHEAPAWLHITAELGVAGPTYAGLAASFADYAALSGQTYGELSEET